MSSWGGNIPWSPPPPPPPPMQMFYMYICTCRTFAGCTCIYQWQIQGYPRVHRHHLLKLEAQHKSKPNIVHGAVVQETQIYSERTSYITKSVCLLIRAHRSLLCFCIQGSIREKGAVQKLATI